MNKREQQKQDTLAQILAVSHELFGRQGFERTSIQQIADACALSKGALYHYFRSKEEVLDEICRRLFEDVNEQFRPIVHIALEQAGQGVLPVNKFIVRHQSNDKIAGL